HRSMLSQVPHQRTSVDVRDDGNAITCEETGNVFLGAPIARQIRQFADNQSFRIRTRGFAVEKIGSVIANVRISKNYNLAGIRRIGEYFLIAGKRSIKNDLAKTLARGAKTAPPEYSSVF